MASQKFNPLKVSGYAMSVLYVLAKGSAKINIVYLLMYMYVHEKAHNDYLTYTYMY